MFLLQESIEKYGILNPLIVRQVPDGYYEIISGHRRKHAAEKLGYRKVPVIIRVLSEDDSILSMVDSNLHRERISYSEKAFAYKLKNDVLKRKSGRKKSQVDHKTPRKRSIDIISEDCGDSPKQVQRYISLTKLIPEMLQKLDDEIISFCPAVEIAALKENEQRELLKAMDYAQAIPSLSQAQRIKQLSKEKQLSLEKMKAVTSEEEETDENAGVESARLAERETEAALRGLRHAQIRSKRTDVKTHRRGYREATVEKKLKFGSAESMEGVKHAESVKNAEQKRHFYNRFFQKKRYKDAYRAARAGKSAGSLGGATTIAGVENMTVKAKIALKEIIKRNRAMFAGIGIFALLFLVIAVSLGSCSASIEGAGSVIGITTYPSSDEDIYAAENRYAALERSNC